HQRSAQGHALGAALMQMPHILVLDEPTQYADHSNLRSSLQFVADWAARFDMAVLLIEHNLPLLSRFCERVFIMERGRLRQGLPEAASFPQCRPRDLNGCKPLIELKEVHYSYRPGKPVLRGADLKIYRSEAVALLGPNGSGKSTLAKIICGLYKPGSGTVRFEGREMSASQERFKRIGLVMQNPDQQLFAPTVMEECSFGPRNFRLPESRYRPMISARLGEFQMGEFEQRDPFSLSYGEKRRVNVTGILACEPDVLILDEPTCALDTENQRILLDLVLKLKSRGKTIIVITHDLNFARAVCTRALLVSRGRIVKDLPMNEIGVREESGERGESGVKYVVS
ncbi:MAG: ATP-binding cassette domain-containing protein, partial [Gemmatimonadota bacterium]|nr:ATP-binding cassette domain-containing protein [Gemmatimonadota bacterium]